MKSDIIVTWPKNCDYPLWRQFIRDNRPRFNEIIVAFMEPNSGHNYTEFIKQSMHQDYVHFLDAPLPKGNEDWRNLAVNASLLHSYNADWIWFTEQDFYPRDGFWDDVGRLENEGCEIIAAYQGNRMHPCCIFSKRTALERTEKNFGIVPDAADHFYLFQKDIEGAGVRVGKINPMTYRHYNGLSHNWRLISEGGSPNYETAEFVDWLRQSVAVRVPQSPFFTEIANAEIIKYGG